MTRHGPALLALSIIAVAGWTYNVNYDTRAALERLSALRGEIAAEREALQVLRVEWAYLNAPDRLANLVAAHNGALGLAPLVPEALGIAAAIPYPPREAPDAAPAALDALVASASPAATATVAPTTGTASTAPQVPSRAAPAGPEPETTVAALAVRETGTGAGPAGPVASAERPEPEAVTLAALAPQPGAPAAFPAAAQGAVLEPVPAAFEASAAEAERVPAALEAAIAAALVEVGVPADGGVDGGGHPRRPRGGVVAPAGILSVAASGVPMPAARPALRPVAWSRP